MGTKHQVLIGCHYRVLAFAILVAFVGFSTPAVAELSLLGVRFGEHAKKTRIVFDLSGPTTFRAFTLRGPDRVVVDMQPMASRIGKLSKTSHGLVRGYRFAAFSQNASRLVLDVASPVRIERSFLLPPDEHYGHRLVIDIRKSEAHVATISPPKLVRPPTRSSVPSKPLPLPNPRRRQLSNMIVIDPGHGGTDPGAIGVNGVYEKNITLRFARDLQAAFKANGGYRTKLTRADDAYVRLRDRIVVAREAAADLFISLHADSLADAAIRGASVYTLSENASDKEAAALAAKENRSDIIAGVDLTQQNDEVTSILIDLTQRETMNRSARYANQILSEIRKSARVLRKSHRFAGFAVLKAPDVPSVLVELGYLSNSRDVRFLSSKQGRKELVDAIIRATDEFFRRRSE